MVSQAIVEVSDENAMDNRKIGDRKMDFGNNVSRERNIGFFNFPVPNLPVARIPQQCDWCIE